MLHFYPLNEFISNLMPATGLKKVGTSTTKGWKKQDILKIFRWENIYRLIKLIDIRSVMLLAIKRRQSRSEVKMDRGSAICERVRKKIVEYLKKKNFHQHQIAMALQISSSTVHNIIKRFR